MAEVHGKGKERAFSTDNIEDAPLFKFCYQHRKRILNPIIDWTESDVWEFIREHNIPYCELYDQGFKRLGCIGCPMGGNKGMKKEFDRYPKFKNLYLYSIKRLMDEREKAGMRQYYESPEAILKWWMQEDNVAPETVITELIE